jgi:hypothetical protein
LPENPQNLSVLNPWCPTQHRGAMLSFYFLNEWMHLFWPLGFPGKSNMRWFRHFRCYFNKLNYSNIKRLSHFVTCEEVNNILLVAQCIGHCSLHLIWPHKRLDSTHCLPKM